LKELTKLDESFKSRSKEFFILTGGRMDWVTLIISLLSGLVGGNITGALQKDQGLGTLGNSVSGVIGGGLGGYILQLLGLFGVAGMSSATGTPAPAATPDIAHMDFAQIIGNIAGSGVGGAILTFIVSYLKNSMSKA
jgi:uncharacterized membrane protein YeaQ/YmgE (transglycosylase-associated protein family)